MDTSHGGSGIIFPHTERESELVWVQGSINQSPTAQDMFWANQAQLHPPSAPPPLPATSFPGPIA